MFLQQVHTRAEELGHEYILPEHLLYQFTETPATIELLEMFQVSPEELREELTMFFENKVERVGECDISFSAIRTDLPAQIHCTFLQSDR